MRSDVLQRRGAVIRILAAASAFALSACVSSPPSRFYTLAPTARAGTASSVSNVSSPAALIEVQSVSIPAQVARNQLVVRISDTRVEVLEDERWASPLSDEIRTALSIAATQQLGSPNTTRLSEEKSATPVYGVAVDVQRFESWPGSRVVVDAVWTIRPAGEAGAKLTCRSTVVEPVAAGYDSLVEGHRRALTAIAQQLAATARRFGLPVGASSSATTTSRSSIALPAGQCPAPATYAGNYATAASVASVAQRGAAQ